MSTLRYLTDPGHGWLEVPFGELKALGLNPTDFSRYSYRDRNTFYLEEDCDAGIFINAFEAKHGRKPEYVEVYCEKIFVRNLPSIY